MTPRSLFKSICAYFIILSLNACNYNPLNNSDTLTGSAVGTAAGAVGGVGIAALLGASSKAVFALAGVTGAGVGYYVTTLRFASAGIIQAGGQVYSLGDFLTVEIPSDQLFESNSDEFTSNAHAILDSAINVLSRSPCNNIMVSGNTSGFATSRFEQKISESRARQVASYLWANGITSFKASSVDTRKLTYVGYGNYFPIANDLHNDSIRANSRIQITVYPSKNDLHLDKRHQVFHNIGDIDEPSMPAEQPVPDITRAFQNGDTLPEQSNRKDEFQDEFKESAGKNTVSGQESRSTDFFPERNNYKGESEEAPIDNTVSNRVKQGRFTGYKGEVE